MTDIRFAQDVTAKAAPPTHCSASTTTLVERMLGLTAVTTLTWCCISLEGGHPSVLLQVVPIAMIAAIALGGLIMSHGPRAIARLLAVCFGASATNEEEAQQLRGLCRRGRRLAYAGGVAQMISGLLHVMSTLDQPSLIGPGIAVTFAGFFWAPVIAELGFGSAEHWVARRSNA